MLIAKIRRANSSEHGYEIKEWWRETDGVVKLKRYDDEVEEVVISENDVIYITDSSEYGNTIAVY